MQDDGSGAAAAAGPSPAVEVVDGRDNLVQVIARYVRRRVCQARATALEYGGTVQRKHTYSPNHKVITTGHVRRHSDDAEEEARLINAAQLLEARLLQCLLRVQLNPSEVPNQPELPGDVSAHETQRMGVAVAAESSEKTVVAPSSETEPTERHRSRRHRSRHIMEEENGRKAADASAGAADTLSPPPRKPRLPFAEEEPIQRQVSPINAAVAAPPHIRDRPKGTRMSSAPSGGPDITAQSSPSATLSRSPSGTKAKELYYAYTHQSLPPPPPPAAAAVRRRTGSAHAVPASSPSSPVPAPSAAAVAGTTSTALESAAGPQSAGQRRRLSQPGGEHQRRRLSQRPASPVEPASSLIVDRPRDGAAPPNASTKTTDTHSSSSSSSSSNSSNEDNNNDNSNDGKRVAPSQGKAEEAHVAASTVYCPRGGTVRPLTPAEVAAAMGSWPSRMIQYSLAKKLAEAAVVESATEASAADGRETSTERDKEKGGEEDGQREKGRAAEQQPQATNLDGDGVLHYSVEEDTELLDFIQRLHDVLQYTTLTTGEVADVTNEERDGKREGRIGDSDATAAATTATTVSTTAVSIPFPSFARFYLSKPALTTNLHDVNGGVGCSCDDVVQFFLAQLTDALVSAAVVPDTAAATTTPTVVSTDEDDDQHAVGEVGTEMRDAQTKNDDENRKKASLTGEAEDQHGGGGGGSPNASATKTTGDETAEAGASLVLTGDMVRDIELLLKHTPTVLTASSPSPLAYAPAPHADAATVNLATAPCPSPPLAAAAARLSSPTRSAVRRALRQLLRLSPSTYNATMCTTPLVVGVLRRYGTTIDADEDDDDDSDGGVEHGTQKKCMRALRIRLVPAAEAMKSTGVSQPTVVASRHDNETAAPMCYNALIIEVTGGDVVYASTENDGSDGGSSNSNRNSKNDDDGVESHRGAAAEDALPLEEEDEAKMIFHADVPEMYRRPRSRDRRAASPHQLQRSSFREGLTEAGEASGVQHDIARSRSRLSRQQCVLWQQLLSVAQFIHVTGTPLQVETTARYIALAIRRRREARQQQQQRSHNQETPLFSSSVPFYGAAAPPSVAESAFPVSVPAFFFTLTETSSLATAAAATRTLQYGDNDGDDDDGDNNDLLRVTSEPKAQQHGATLVAGMHDAQLMGMNPKELRERQARQSSAGVGVGGATTAAPPATPVARSGFFSSGPGLGLRALLGWRTPAAAAATTAPPKSPSPPCQPRLSSPSPDSATAHNTATAVSAVASAEDLMLQWMHDTLIPIFYETTVTFSEAGEIDLSAPDNAGDKPACAAADVRSGSKSSTVGNRRHRYRLRRQHALLGRVQAITAAMIGNSNSDAKTPSASARVVGTQLISYLLLHQLFFLDAAETAVAATAADSVDTVAPHGGSRRAYSVPTPRTAATTTTMANDTVHDVIDHHNTNHNNSNCIDGGSLRQRRRAFSATPHRGTRAAQPRRVSFRENDGSASASQQLVTLSEAPHATTQQQQHQHHGDHENTAGEVSLERSDVTAATTRLESPSSLPSPKSILKSGRRYRAERLVRSSAPATPVVPFRSFLLWRWLAAEAFTTSHVEARDESARTTAETHVPSAAQLSPMLHLSSASYVAQAQSLAVTVATDVTEALLLAGIQAEQYACYAQLHQEPASSLASEDDGTSHGEKEPTINPHASTAASAVAARASATRYEKAGGDRVDAASPSPAAVLATRHATMFKCDEILPLAKSVAEAVVKAALAPLICEADVPLQLRSVMQEGDLAAVHSGDEDVADDDSAAAAGEGSDDSRIDGGDDGLCASGPAISLLSPNLSPDVYHRFQVLFAVCTYRVQREVLSSVARPLDLALRRLTWGLAQHRLHLLCQPLRVFWKTEFVALSEAAALLSSSLTFPSASSSFLSRAKTSIEVQELQKRCVAAQRGLCVLVNQVLQFYEDCLVLPHLLTRVGASRPVELSLGEEENDLGAEEGGGGKALSHSMKQHGNTISNSNNNNNSNKSSSDDNNGNSDGAQASKLCKRYPSPLTPLGGGQLPSPPPSPQKAHRAVNSAVYLAQQPPSPHQQQQEEQQQQQQQQQRSVSAFVPLSFGEVRLPHQPTVTTFATPAEGSVSPTSLQQQQQQQSSMPQWSCIAALSAWNPIDVDTSFDLHSSLCDDWRSLRLSGAGGELGRAASDFAVAVAAVSSLRVHPPSALHIISHAAPHNATATSSSRVAESTTAVTATAATFSMPDVLLSASSDVLHAGGTSQSECTRDGKNSGDTVPASSPAPTSASARTPAATTDATLQQQQQQQQSLLRMQSPSVSFASPFAEADAAPVRPCFSINWVKPLPYHEQQELQYAHDSQGVLSHSSFLTLNVVTPPQQRFYVPIFGGSAGEGTKGGSVFVVPAVQQGEVTAAVAVESAPLRDAPDATTESSVSANVRAVAAARGERNMGGEGEEKRAEEAADAPSVPALEHASPPPVSRTLPLFAAARLRNGNVVESHLLSPFVEEAKRMLTGLLLQHWVLPRWGLLTQLSVDATERAEKGVKSTARPPPPLVQRSSTQAQTDDPLPTPPQPQKEQKQQSEKKPECIPRGSELAGEHHEHDGQHHRQQDKDDDDCTARCTAKLSFDVPTFVDQSKEAGKRNEVCNGATPLTPPLPSPSPSGSPPTPSAVVENTGSAQALEEEKVKNTADAVTVVEPITHGGNAELQARRELMQRVLDDIVQSCRSLTTAATQYELALVLAGSTSLPSMMTSNWRSHDPDVDVDDAKEKDMQATLSQHDASMCARSSSATLPAASESPSSTSPPSAVQTPPTQPPPPPSSASRDFLSKTRRERERILALCRRMSDLLAGKTVTAAAVETLEEDADFHLQPLQCSNTHRGDEGDVHAAGTPPNHSQHELSSAPFNSLSQGICGPPCPTPLSCELTAAGAAAEDSQQLQVPRPESFPGSSGPSQLFIPLREPTHLLSTAFTLSSMPVPLAGALSSAPLSTLSSEVDEATTTTTTLLDGSALVSVPAPTAAAAVVPLSAPHLLQFQLSSGEGTEILPRAPAQLSATEEAATSEGVQAQPPVISHQNDAQQTETDEGSAPARDDASTQTPLCPGPASTPPQAAAVEGVDDVVDDRKQERSSMPKVGSQRSVETAEVTPYKHRHRRSRHCRAPSGEAGADDNGDRGHEKRQRSTGKEDLDDSSTTTTTTSSSSSSTLSPVSVHSSAQLSNAFLSGCSSPMLSNASTSSLAVAAASLAPDVQQQQRLALPPHAWCADVEEGGKGRDEVADTPRRTGTTAAGSGEEGAADSHVEATHRGQKQTAVRSADSAATKLTTTTKAYTSTWSPPPSPWREHTPTRHSEAAVSALADLQQRLSGSNSTVVELRQRLEKAEADVCAKEKALTRVQQQLATTEAALRRAMVSQEAELENMQLRPPPPLTPARCSVAISTVGVPEPQKSKEEELPLQQQQQQPSRRSLSPLVSSTPVKEVKAVPLAVDRVEAGVQVSLKAPTLPPSTRDQDESEALQGPPPPAAVSANTVTTQTAPPDVTLLASHNATECRVREMEAELRNANFRMAQWKALLEAERHARAVQVDQLSQQLENEQRRLRHRGSSSGASGRSSLSRSLSPLQPEKLLIRDGYGGDGDVVMEGITSPLASLPPPPNLVNKQVCELRGAAARAAECGASNATNKVEANNKEEKADEEQQQQQQQTAELKAREEALQQHIARVLYRLHVAETQLDEQRQQAQHDAAAAAAAAVVSEGERTRLEQRVAALESEVKAANVCLHEQASASSLSSSLPVEPAKVQQQRADDKVQHEKEMAALRREAQEKSREAHERSSALAEEQAAHARSKMALSTAQAAMAAAQVVHKAETAFLQRGATVWWTSFEDLGSRWTDEKVRLVLTAYAERLVSAEEHHRAALAGASETAAVQDSTLATLRVALATTRDEAARREADLQREVSALRQEVTALAAARIAAAATAEQHARAHAAQAARYWSSATAWWSAERSCTAQWAEAKLACAVAAYASQRCTREQQHGEQIAEAQNVVVAQEATITTLQEELDGTQQDLKEARESMHAQEEAHERVVAELSRVQVAHAAAQEALRKDTAHFLRCVESWWAAGASCLAECTLSKASAVGTTCTSMLQVLAQEHREALRKAASATTAHEAAVERLHRALADAQSIAQNQESKLHEETKAHTRTVAALQATQAASEVMRRSEAAQQTRLQRNTAVWWAAREACAADWTDAKMLLLQDAYASQQQHFAQSVSATVNEHVRQLEAVQLLTPIKEAEAHPPAVAPAVLPTATATPVQVDDGAVVRSRRSRQQHHQKRSHSDKKRDEARSSSRSAADGSPEVLVMSLEDPLGLRYELQRKTRRLHSAEEQVRQLEMAHKADREALAAIQAMLQQERCAAVSPPSASITAGMPDMPSPLPYRSSSSSNNSQAWPAPRSMPSAAATSSRSPSFAMSRRLTPSEYCQRFAGV